jgi:hypothetical protein
VTEVEQIHPITVSQIPFIRKSLHIVLGYALCATDGSLEKQSNQFAVTDTESVFTLEDLPLNISCTLPQLSYVSILSCETLVILLAIETTIINKIHYLHVISDSKGAVVKALHLKDSNWITDDVRNIAKNIFEQELWN